MKRITSTATDANGNPTTVTQLIPETDEDVVELLRMARDGELAEGGIGPHNAIDGPSRYALSMDGQWWLDADGNRTAAVSGKKRHGRYRRTRARKRKH